MCFGISFTWLGAISPKNTHTLSKKDTSTPIPPSASWACKHGKIQPMTRFGTIATTPPISTLSSPSVPYSPSPFLYYDSASHSYGHCSISYSYPGTFYCLYPTRHKHLTHRLFQKNNVYIFYIYCIKHACL